MYAMSVNEITKLAVLAFQ